MPYKEGAPLPKSVQQMTPECQAVFREVFNDCYDQGTEERRCLAIAYTAAKEHEDSYGDDEEYEAGDEMSTRPGRGDELDY